MTASKLVTGQKIALNSCHIFYCKLNKSGSYIFCIKDIAPVNCKLKGRQSKHPQDVEVVPPAPE